MPALNKTIAAVVAVSFGLAACTNSDGTDNNTGTGVLAGAATGALLGSIIGDSPKSRAVGAMAGAMIGGTIGNNLDKQEAELRQNLSGTGAGIVNTGSQLIVTLPESITFDFDSAKLNPQFVAPIQDVALSLQKYPNTIVQVIGHTDSIGSIEHNNQLSQQRAQSVANVLLNSGVGAGRLRVIGVGSTRPVASNETAAGRAMNRRVEIVITPN